MDPFLKKWKQIALLVLVLPCVICCTPTPHPPGPGYNKPQCINVNTPWNNPFLEVKLSYDKNEYFHSSELEELSKAHNVSFQNKQPITLLENIVNAKTEKLNQYEVDRRSYIKVTLEGSNCLGSVSNYYRAASDVFHNTIRNYPSIGGHLKRTTIIIKSIRPLMSGYSYIWSRTHDGYAQTNEDIKLIIPYAELTNLPRSGLYIVYDNPGDIGSELPLHYVEVNGIYYIPVYNTLLQNEPIIPDLTAPLTKVTSYPVNGLSDKKIYYNGSFRDDIAWRTPFQVNFGSN